MSRITDRFKSLRRENKTGLVIFLTAGDPAMKATVDLVKAAFDNGADVVELGVPFSDPLADGPVIQESFHRAISRGATLVKSFTVVEKIRKSHDDPLVFMLASTLVINHGVKKFVKDAKGAGVDGIIIPDAPMDEAAEFSEPAKKVGLDTILLAAPTSTPTRLRRIAKNSSGFLYYISVTGVTGKNAANPKEVSKNIKALKKMTRLPVCAGFGVTTPAQAKEMARHADGVIIGTQAIRVIKEAKNRAAATKNLASFVRSIRRGMDK